MALLASAPTARADMLTFNALDPGGNAATRASWLAAAGIASPQYLIDFESGFADLQNVSGVSALFPGGLVITDTSAGQAIVRSGAGVIGGSNPVGTFSLTHNEQAYLELDFSANPIDYLGFLDIDQAGTLGTVTFVGGTTAPFTFETTGGSGNSAEFFGIFRNDLPRIVLVQFDASGDGRWGLDNLEYGTTADLVVPEPATLLLLGTGLVTGSLVRRRRRQ